MRLRDVRLAWRLLIKEPAYSAVAILGLAVALATFFLLTSLVRYAWTYNAAIADADRILVVKERKNLLPRPDWSEDGPAPLAAAAIAAGLVRDSTGARPAEVGARIDGRLIQIKLAVVAPNYLRFFGIQAVSGNADAALARPDSLVLSREVATHLFGTVLALGKTLTIDGQPFVVRAVLPDLPANTSPDFGILVGQGEHSWDERPNGVKAEWFQRVRTYLKPAPGVTAGRLAAALEEFVAIRRDDVFLSARLVAGHQRPWTSIAVTPLSQVYFDADLLSGRSAERYGSPAAIAGLGGLALLILVLAATNTVNLAAVRTAARRREIGVRKALGAGGGALAAQFLAESLVVGAGATLIGALLAWLLLPLFADLVGRPLAATSGPMAWCVLVATGLGTSLLAGLYPVWLAARVPASAALSGRSGASGEGYRMRRWLTVAQFAAAIGLVATTLVVWWQAQYASHADPGFDPRTQLVLQLPGEPKSAAVHAFKAELARLPGVDGVAAMSEAVGRDGMKMVVIMTRPGMGGVPIEMKQVGANFFRVFGLRPVFGRLFERDKDTGIVLNARAARALGFASPQAAVGQMLGDQRIIGIAPDLRFATLRQQPGPILYQMNEDQGVATVRVRGSLMGARAAIDMLWQRHFPNDPVDIETAASVFAHNYSDDLRQAKLLTFASLVATALACCGIYVLSSYTIRRRAREIVLRKLHGARPRDIGVLVAREWLLLFAGGAALALAPAWVWRERYLAAFVEHAPMGVWPLVLAAVVVGAVALVACARQTWTAMRMAPALALRD